MSNFTDAQLEAKVVGLKVNDCYFWVDQTGAVTLPAFTIDVKDLREIHRKAESWLAQRALHFAPSKSYPKPGN